MSDSADKGYAGVVYMPVLRDGLWHGVWVRGWVFAGKAIANWWGTDEGPESLDYDELAEAERLMVWRQE